MNRLLKAGFRRLKKDKVFWSILIIFLILGIIMCLFQYRDMVKYNTTTQLDNIIFNSLTFIGIAISIFTCLFVGKEHSDGTIKNKIIIGHNRKSIYFSNLVITIISSIIINLTFILIVAIVGIPLFGMLTIPMSATIWLIIDIIFMIIAYCSIFNMIAILCSNKTISVIISILLIFGLMAVSAVILNILQQPKYLDQANMVDGQIVMEKVQNLQYPTESEKKVYQFILDFLPTGQGFQIAGGIAPNIKVLALYSFIIFFIINSVGVVIFRKIDLK